METTVHFNKDIQLTLSELIDLAKQLPKNERLKLASVLVEESPTNKNALIAKIEEGLQDVKLHKEGKIKLRALKDFLADV